MSDLPALVTLLALLREHRSGICGACVEASLGIAASEAETRLSGVRELIELSSLEGTCPLCRRIGLVHRVR
jgi:hypothetical protein